MGEAARRHSADPDGRRRRPPAFAGRSDRPPGGRGDLSPDLAPARPLRPGDAGSVQRHARLSRREGQGAVHHRHRRLGRRRQVDHRPRSAGAAAPLAEHAEGRSRHDRRVPASEQDPRGRGPDGPQGLPGKLRPSGAPPVHVGHQGRQAPRHGAGLFASDLRRHPRHRDRGREAGHPHPRRAQRAAGRPRPARTARPSRSCRTSSTSRCSSTPTRR